MESERATGPVPSAWISGCAAAHARLHTIAQGVNDEIARRATLLPGWTVGHLLTHLARNADSHRGMVEAAQRGEIIPQYPGGPPQRNRDIESGAGRSASDLISDLRMADENLERAWATTDETVWLSGLGLRRYGPATLAEFVLLRWREVEIHLVDLDLPELGSPNWDGLSPAYIDVELQEVSRGLAARVPESTTIVLAPGDRPSRAYGTGDDRVVIAATPGQILAWLMGRGGDASWPSLRPWE
jgi:maleylpyruvate isomerase